jgi:hypothetical protein
LSGTFGTVFFYKYNGDCKGRQQADRNGNKEKYFSKATADDIYELNTKA